MSLPLPPLSFHILDEEDSPADAPPVQVLPDDLPSSQTAYGRDDYRRFFTPEIIVNLNGEAASGNGIGVLENTLPPPNAPGASGRSSAFLLVAAAAVVFLMFSDNRR